MFSMPVTPFKLEDSEGLPFTLKQPTPCAEPHHAHQHDEKAHRAHHWKERLFCLSCCTTLHFLLEIASHYNYWMG